MHARTFAMVQDVWTLIALAGASREVRALAAAGMVAGMVDADARRVAAVLCQRAWRRRGWESAPPAALLPGDRVLLITASTRAGRGGGPRVAVLRGRVAVTCVCPPPSANAEQAPEMLVSIHRDRVPGTKRHVYFFFGPAHSIAPQRGELIRSVKRRVRGA